MYKRHWLGVPAAETTTLSDVFVFFLFCAALAWLLPYGIEAVSGHPLEVFTIPPIWRGEIMCASPGSPADRDYTYVYTDKKCIVKCKTPGCPEGAAGPQDPISDAEIAINIRTARADLDLGDIFELMIAGIKYGTALVSFSSLGVMLVSAASRPPWVWLCVPCAAGGAMSFFEPALLPAAAAAWVAAYALDLWSTSRFGRRNAYLKETNPVLRPLLRRFGMRAAFAMHAAAYGGGFAGFAALVYAIDPPLFGALLAPLAFGLAAMHVWAAASNIREYRYSKLV